MSCLDAPNFDQFNEIFDGRKSDDLNISIRLALKQKCWSENTSDPIDPSNRCLCWRFLFGLLSADKESWVAELNRSTVEYDALKKDIFPSICNVGFDPLSDDNPDTVSYFERVEQVNASTSPVTL